MKKIKRFILPLLIMSLFVLLMNSGVLLKNSFNSEDNVSLSVEKLEKELSIENWTEANDALKVLDLAWKNVQKRVQFSVEKDQMKRIEVNLLRLEGCIKAKDKSSALIELNEMKGHWYELGDTLLFGEKPFKD
ncbi:DUF4363 family protein [Clostridium grantii]|uniref:DUF4363 domain-containing protein n=1 Tax=Clostridium grantii DSM 8605 TaxID=1121316 RepID=A0A1M5X7W0_9CLOT|nr:DUF4363 family protein [Clostridium grantii]SHH95564.1 protein of unknown function [Clostridium grantii DSM 8605]